MAKVYVFLAEGFEDVEALILQYFYSFVILAFNMASFKTKGIEADTIFEQCDFSDADLLFLPGGMPGASNLYAHEGVCETIKNQHLSGHKVAAICASPAVVLAPLGVLDGKRATCYPGFEEALAKGHYTGALITVDGNVTTGEGPAAAFPFAYELLAQMTSPQEAQQIAEGMRFTHLMAR